MSALTGAERALFLSTALDAFAKAYAGLVKRNGELLMLMMKDRQAEIRQISLPIPREQSRPYMIAINAFFAAGKELQIRAGTLVPDALQTRFDLWFAEVGATCTLWVQQAQSGETIGETFGKFLGMTSPGGGDVALEYAQAVADAAEDLGDEALGDDDMSWRFRTSKPSDPIPDWMAERFKEIPEIEKFFSAKDNVCHATTDLRKHIHKAGFGPLPEEVLENYKHLVIEFSLCGLELGVPFSTAPPPGSGTDFRIRFQTSWVSGIRKTLTMEGPKTSLEL